MGYPRRFSEKKIPFFCHITVSCGEKFFMPQAGMPRQAIRTYCADGRTICARYRFIFKFRFIDPLQTSQKCVILSEQSESKDLRTEKLLSSNDNA